MFNTLFSDYNISEEGDVPIINFNVFNEDSKIKHVTFDDGIQSNNNVNRKSNNDNAIRQLNNNIDDNDNNDDINNNNNNILSNQYFNNLPINPTQINIVNLDSIVKFNDNITLIPKFNTINIQYYVINKNKTIEKGTTIKKEIIMEEGIIKETTIEKDKTIKRKSNRVSRKNKVIISKIRSEIALKRTRTKNGVFNHDKKYMLVAEKNIIDNYNCEASLITECFDLCDNYSITINYKHYHIKQDLYGKFCDTILIYNKFRIKVSKKIVSEKKYNEKLGKEFTNNYCIYQKDDSILKILMNLYPTTC